jgi:hypothetical protein
MVLSNAKEAQEERKLNPEIEEIDVAGTNSLVLAHGILVQPDRKRKRREGRAYNKRKSYDEKLGSLNAAVLINALNPTALLASSVAVDIEPVVRSKVNRHKSNFQLVAKESGVSLPRVTRAIV